MAASSLNIDLFISTQCPHCSQALELLSKAVKQGDIGQLNIINLNSSNNSEQYSHIRSVPFIQIDDYEFNGNLKKSELDDWIKADKEDNFAGYYFSTLLMDGQISQVENFIKRKTNYLLELIKLAQDENAKMQVRIGITAVFESIYSEIPKLSQSDEIINSLIQATDTDNHAIRVDLIYILSLVFKAFKDQQQKNSELNTFMLLASKDSSEEINEIANDVLNN